MKVNNLINAVDSFANSKTDRIQSQCNEQILVWQLLAKPDKATRYLSNIFYLLDY